MSQLFAVNLVLLLISFACLPVLGSCSWPAMLSLFLTMDQRSSSLSVLFSSLDDGSAQQRPGFGCFMDGEWLAARGLFCCL